MARQLISTNKQPLLRSDHEKRPLQSGFGQVRLPEGFLLVPNRMSSPRPNQDLRQIEHARIGTSSPGGLSGGRFSLTTSSLPIGWILPLARE
jgi:hypothetical protein